MTLVFALITCSALFVCARNLQLPISVCLLSALLPLASPIFVGLSYSFMTDVPAAAFVMLSLSFFIRSFNKSDGGSVDYSMGFVFLLLAVAAIESLPLPNKVAVPEMTEILFFFNK